MARLDRLGSAKEVAQIGAAIGREFSHALVCCVPQRLASALDRLIAAGLLFRQGVPPHANTFSNMPWCRTPPTGHCCASLKSTSRSHR